MRATKIFIGGPVYTGGNGWRPAEALAVAGG